MTYYGATDLANAFRTVRKNTIAAAEDIPEDKYGFQAFPESKTVGQLLVHIASATKLGLQIHKVEKRTTLEGFNFPEVFGGIIAEEQKPRTKAEIIALLKENGETVASWLEGLSDEFLGERVSMMPGMQPASKTRFEMILGMKEHEMHHRAQLMVSQRLLGITPHLTRERQAQFAAAAQK